MPAESSVRAASAVSVGRQRKLKKAYVGKSGGYHLKIFVVGEII